MSYVQIICEGTVDSKASGSRASAGDRVTSHIVTANYMYYQTD